MGGKSAMMTTGASYPCGRDSLRCKQGCFLGANRMLRGNGGLVEKQLGCEHYNPESGPASI